MGESTRSKRITPLQHLRKFSGLIAESAGTMLDSSFKAQEAVTAKTASIVAFVTIVHAVLAGAPVAMRKPGNLRDLLQALFEEVKEACRDEAEKRRLAQNKAFEEGLAPKPWKWNKTETASLSTRGIRAHRHAIEWICMHVPVFGWKPTLAILDPGDLDGKGRLDPTWTARIGKLFRALLAPCEASTLMIPVAYEVGVKDPFPFALDSETWRKTHEGCITKEKGGVEHIDPFHVGDLQLHVTVGEAPSGEVYEKGRILQQEAKDRSAYARSANTRAERDNTPADCQIREAIPQEDRRSK